VDSKLGSGESRRRITAAAAARRFDLRSRHLAARIPMARLHWLEAMLPLGIIGGMLCIMGNAQYYIHRAAHGRPKHIGNDNWDMAMARRDKVLLHQASSENN
jgi:NADH dehydrogenase (ubiquinone) 1 alpha subcomplex subunit 1